MHVRPATPLDSTAVANLLNRAYALVDVNLGETPEAVTERGHGSLVVVAELLGAVVGTMTLSRAGTHTMLASRLAVDPVFQGRGVGSQMLQTVTESCRQHGFTSIVGASMDSMTSAHRLYESIGAEQTTIPAANARGYTLDLTL